MPYTTKLAYSINCTGSKLNHILVLSLLIKSFIILLQDKIFIDRLIVVCFMFSGKYSMHIQDDTFCHIVKLQYCI